MCTQILVFLTLYSASYITTLLIGLFFNSTLLANLLGFLSLLCYIATLLPSLLKAVFPALKKNKLLILLLKYRRHIGVAAFCFGANHAVLLILERQLNLLDWHTYTHYFQGISTLTIFTLLAITSNDESVKTLKQNWKKLHKLTYLAIFILPCHILDKMSMQWSHLTPFGIVLTLGILILFAIKTWLDVTKPKAGQKFNRSKVSLSE